MKARDDSLYTIKAFLKFGSEKHIQDLSINLILIVSDF